ncbi:MAG: ATP-binding protein, partial [Anaerolineae bacterium]
LSGAALLVAIAIGISTAHWITEPIRRLNIAVKELGRGHWKQAPITNRRDEIGELAREFSAMAAALTEKEEQLRAYADALEQRVAERTAALQESQRQLTTLLNNLPGMAYRGLADPRRTMQYLSEGCLKLTGYTDAELTGNHLLSFADLIVEEDRQRVWDEIQDAIARRASYVIEYRIRTRNGDLRWVWEKGSGVFDDSNTLVALEGFISDITDRKQAELALQQALEELKRSNTDLERFAYVASHDLQEPLRTVSSFVQLLGERYQGQLDADADEFIRFAIDGVKRMQTLINDLLEYSRVNTRQAPLQPTDANMALDIALWNLNQAIAEAEASVTHTPLPIVLADATQLVQLFQNLIGNAIKFRGAEPPQIHISARQISQAGEVTASATMWEFAVRDNGIGIAPEDHERIFGLFQRAHSRQQYPGSGIGLAVCQRIVERHGGRIWVESQPGQGSTFFFTLPAAEQTSHV